MATMNISLPDEMKDFIEEQVSARGYITSSEYVRDVIRREQDRERLRNLVLEGLESGPAEEIGADYAEHLKARILSRHSG